ncbi:MAG: serine acetyltransferase [Deltaproteobacteria bacterium]|nr:serine acetyltransferase [Deltaproteobacteria bacterium]
MKHNGIWGLKRHLFQSDSPNPRLVEIYDAYFSRYGSWIGYDSRFAGEPCFPHGCYGVFISGGSKFGRNTVIFQQVTIGSNALNDSDKAGAPVIGDNVYIGAGAKIIGNVVIGDNCRIGANAVVYQDMPPHSVAVQAPTRIIRKSGLDNRFYSRRNGRLVYFRDGAWIEDSEKSI